ncbi:MAG: hypothetical protein LC640_12040, partial [Frankia sp.]|nr:hypothetical protein [Frankia sp.]
MSVVAVAALAMAGQLAASARPASRGPAAPVTVGTLGNEPLVAVAPDGTVYVAALQFLYRSTDHGKTWAQLELPVFSGVTEYKTDSSIAVDPGGQLYYTFDYPYA